MARPRLPDAVKRLRGTDKVENMNPDQPQAGTDDLQFIPDELSEVARKHWAKIRPMLVESGVATNLDRGSMILLCETWATFLQAMASVRSTGILIQSPSGPVRNPYLSVVQESTKALTRLFTEFGMTPAARSRVTSTGRKPKRGSVYDDL